MLPTQDPLISSGLVGLSTIDVSLEHEAPIIIVFVEQRLARSPGVLSAFQADLSRSG